MALWLVAATLSWQAFQTQQVLRQAEAERDALRAQLTALRASEVQPAPIKPEPPYLRDALQLAQMAQFDSAAVFRAIEAVRVPGVRVTALEVSAADATARVDLEVTVPEALLRYVSELNAGEPTPRWTIVRSQGAAPGAVPTASLLAQWRR
jgi:hypothetical protein